MDNAGNLEVKPTALEAGTYLANTTPPSFAVTSVDPTTSTFAVNFSGSVATGESLDHVDVYVSVDGAAPIAIGRSANASGTINYSAIVDGQSHTYNFYAVGTDNDGNLQKAPTAGYDQTVTATFGTPATNAPTGLTVDHGAIGRSFVRYVDLVFNNASNLAGMIANGAVQLVKHNLDGTGATTISPSAYSLNVVDHAIEFDFGAAGLGGSPLSAAGDGYYEIDVTGNKQAFYFDRLFGDVNGDGTVDSIDVALVTSVLGTTTNAVDVDGSGTVTVADRTAVQRAKGHSLGAGLHLDA